MGKKIHSSHRYEKKKHIESELLSPSQTQSNIEKKYEIPTTVYQTEQPTEKESKMRIKVQYLGMVKTYTNKTQDEIIMENEAKLSDLLNKIASEFGKQFNKDIYEPGMRDVKPMFTVMVNGIVMGQLDGVDTKLKDADNVIIMPLMTGG